MPIRQFEITGIKHTVYPMRSLALKITYKDGDVRYQYLTSSKFSEPLIDCVEICKSSERTEQAAHILAKQILSLFSENIDLLCSVMYMGVDPDMPIDILSFTIEEKQVQGSVCDLLGCKHVAVVNAIQITHN